MAFSKGLMYQFLARVTNKQKEKNKQNSQVYYLWCVSYYFKQFVHLITHLSLLRCVSLPLFLLNKMLNSRSAEHALTQDHEAETGERQSQPGSWCTQGERSISKGLLCIQLLFAAFMF